VLKPKSKQVVVVENMIFPSYLHALRVKRPDNPEAIGSSRSVFIPDDLYTFESESLTAVTNWPVASDVSSNFHGSNSGSDSEEEEECAWTEVKSKRSKRGSRGAGVRATTGRNNRRVVTSNRGTPRPYTKSASRTNAIQRQGEKAVDVFLRVCETTEVFVSALHTLPVHPTTKAIVKSVYGDLSVAKKRPASVVKRYQTQVQSDRTKPKTRGNTSHGSYKGPESQQTTVNHFPRVSTPTVRWANHGPVSDKVVKREEDVCIDCGHTFYIKDMVPASRKKVKFETTQHANMVIIDKVSTPGRTLRSHSSGARISTEKVKSKRVTKTSEISNSVPSNDGTITGIDAIPSIPTASDSNNCDLIDTVEDDLKPPARENIITHTDNIVETNDNEWYMEYINADIGDLQYPNATLSTFSEKDEAIVIQYLYFTFGSIDEVRITQLNRYQLFRIHSNISTNLYDIMVRSMNDKSARLQRQLLHSYEDTVGNFTAPPTNSVLHPVPIELIVPYSFQH
jgi:hypothetical protein